MRKYLTSENNGVRLKPAKRNINYLLIGFISALLIIIDMYNYYNQHIMVPMAIYIVSLMLGYFMYSLLMILVSRLWNKFVYPTMIWITDEGLETTVGIMRYKYSVKDFIIDDPPYSLSKLYESANPKMLVINILSNKRMYIVLDESETSKLRY